MQKEVSISFIKEFPSVKEGIFYLSGISKSGLKKFNFKKNFLEKKIQKGDTLSFPIDLVNYRKINPVYSGEKINIIYEDENLIAISKPNQIHSHPLIYSDSQNVLSGFYSISKEAFLNVNIENQDRGLMYRLDYETSGLLLYLKHQKLIDYVRERFKETVYKKLYLAVVEGELKNCELKHKIKASGVKGRKMIESDEGDECCIHIVQKSYSSEKNISLIQVQLIEGRRHQIRAQLSIAGYPILGDKLYGGQEADRLFLHCYQYKFQLAGKDYDLKDESSQVLSELFNGN